RVSSVRRGGWGAVRVCAIITREARDSLRSTSGVPAPALAGPLANRWGQQLGRHARRLAQATFRSHRQRNRSPQPPPEFSKTGDRSYWRLPVHDRLLAIPDWFATHPGLPPCAAIAE